MPWRVINLEGSAGTARGLGGARAAAAGYSTTWMHACHAACAMRYPTCMGEWGRKGEGGWGGVGIADGRTFHIPPCIIHGYRGPGSRSYLCYQEMVHCHEWGCNPKPRACTRARPKHTEQSSTTMYQHADTSACMFSSSACTDSGVLLPWRLDVIELEQQLQKTASPRCARV